jgi:hypothetical protein
VAINPDATSAVLVDELEATLLELSPTEAVAAADYVLQPDVFHAGARDRALSFPGAELATLFGPIMLHWIIQVALDFFGEARKAALKELASKAIGHLASRSHCVPRTPRPSREDAVREIYQALVAAGWLPDSAMSAAVRLWEAGNRAGEKLAMS